MAESTSSRINVENVFSEEMFAELVELCSDFERLWNAPTTEARDRNHTIARQLFILSTTERASTRTGRPASPYAAVRAIDGSTTFSASATS